METYEARLASFKLHPTKRKVNEPYSATVAWPHHATRFSVTPSTLARAGFYHDPTESAADNVTCVYCGKGLEGWEDGDDALDEHLKRVLDKSTGEKCPWATLVGIQRDFDLFGPEEYENGKHDPSISLLVKARKNTFGSWWKFDAKKGWKPTSERLATAGFYNTPLQDSLDTCACAYCDVQLDGWSKNDDPAEEHRSRRPDCYFFTAMSRASTSTAKTPKAENLKSSRSSRKKVAKDVESETETRAASTRLASSTSSKKKQSKAQSQPAIIEIDGTDDDVMATDLDDESQAPSTSISVPAQMRKGKAAKARSQIGHSLAATDSIIPVRDTNDESDHAEEEEQVSLARSRTRRSVAAPAAAKKAPAKGKKGAPAKKSTRSNTSKSIAAEADSVSTATVLLEEDTRSATDTTTMMEDSIPAAPAKKPSKNRKTTTTKAPKATKSRKTTRSQQSAADSAADEAAEESQAPESEILELDTYSVVEESRPASETTALQAAMSDPEDDNATFERLLDQSLPTIDSQKPSSKARTNRAEPSAAPADNSSAPSLSKSARATTASESIPLKALLAPQAEEPLLAGDTEGVDKTVHLESVEQDNANHTKPAFESAREVNNYTDGKKAAYTRRIEASSGLEEEDDLPQASRMLDQRKSDTATVSKSQIEYAQVADMPDQPSTVTDTSDMAIDQRDTSSVEERSGGSSQKALTPATMTVPEAKSQGAHEATPSMSSHRPVKALPSQRQSGAMSMYTGKQLCARSIPLPDVSKAQSALDDLLAGPMPTFDSPEKAPDSPRRVLTPVASPLRQPTCIATSHASASLAQTLSTRQKQGTLDWINMVKEAEIKRYREESLKLLERYDSEVAARRDDVSHGANDRDEDKTDSTSSISWWL